MGCAAADGWNYLVDSLVGPIEKTVGTNSLIDHISATSKFLIHFVL